MFQLVDQLGCMVEIKKPPLRIISLVPSQTEFLWDLGVGSSIVGITKFCIHPDTLFKACPKIGGTKKLNLELIDKLNPDLIIGNKEENEVSQINLLKGKYPVWMSDIHTFEDAFNMMLSMGSIFGKELRAQQLIIEIKNSLNTIRNVLKGLSCAYFIWRKPYMLAAANTFIDSVMQHIGLINAAKHLERYPETNEEMLVKMNPDLSFLSSEPYPFNEKHEEEIRQILKDSKVLRVDGEIFSWYGTRMLKLENYVLGLLLEIN